MKVPNRLILGIEVPVAPRAGVWIESIRTFKIDSYNLVAPRAGVWIERDKKEVEAKLFFVAPRAGVWIERDMSFGSSLSVFGRSPCGSVD